MLNFLIFCIKIWIFISGGVYLYIIILQKYKLMHL